MKKRHLSWTKDTSTIRQANKSEDNFTNGETHFEQSTFVSRAIEHWYGLCRPGYHLRTMLLYIDGVSQEVIFIANS